MIELERVTHDLTPITVTAYAESEIQLLQKVGIQIEPGAAVLLGDS